MDSKESNKSIQQNNKKRIAIAIIALAVLALVVALILYFNSGEKEEEYVKQEVTEQEEITFTSQPAPQTEQPQKVVKEKPKKEQPVVIAEEEVVDTKEIDNPKGYLIIKNKEIKGSSISWIVKNDSKSTIYEVHRFKLELQNQSGKVLDETEIEEKFVIHPQEELNFSRKKPKWGSIDYWGVSFINDNIRIIKQ